MLVIKILLQALVLDEVCYALIISQRVCAKETSLV